MLTLLEGSKQIQDPLRTSIIEPIVAVNPIFERMPFLTIQGTTYKYLVEGTLPTTGRRKINEGFTESTGTDIPKSEELKPFGGELDIDNFLIDANGGDPIDVKANQINKKSKSLSRTWLKEFFDGDNEANPEEVDGLNKRLEGSSTQIIDAGTGGAELTLTMVDDLIDAVQGEANLLLMNKKLRRKITRLAQSHSTVTMSTDALGRKVTEYAGIPIGIVEVDAAKNAILGFDEDDGNGSVFNTASIYALRIEGDEGVHGVDHGPLQVRDFGELQSKPAHRVRVQWANTWVLPMVEDAARLVHVDNV